MALIEISETQLAFGYLHSYINVYSPQHFLLPSIRQEGGQVNFNFPGADVILNSNHLIQFKRPNLLKTNSIKEFYNYSKPSDINPPYFRFHIKNDSPTNQLSNLVTATQRGLTAEYISPLFSKETEFFSLIRDDYNHLQAYAHIDIGQFNGMLELIGDNNDHTILYNQQSVENSFCYCFSEPKKIRAFNGQENSFIVKGDREFNAFELVNLLRSIFFKEQDFKSPSDNALLECHRLQNKLMIEQNIIWYFNYKLKE